MQQIGALAQEQSKEHEDAMVHCYGEFFKLLFAHLINTKPISVLSLRCVHLVE